MNIEIGEINKEEVDSRSTIEFNKHLVEVYKTHYEKKIKYNPGKIYHIDNDFCNISTSPRLILSKYLHFYTNPHPGAVKLMKDFLKTPSDLGHLYDQIGHFLSVNPNPNAVKLLEQFNLKIDWTMLSANQGALHILEKVENINNVDWQILSIQPWAIDLLKKNIDRINWTSLSANKRAIVLLEQNIDKIDWTKLSSNPEAIHILNQHPNKIVWDQLSRNPNPGAIDLLKKNPEKIDWNVLSVNPSSFELLKENHELVNWGYLSLNPADWAIKMLRENPYHIDWDRLSLNESKAAIKLLIENPDKINLNIVCHNQKFIRIIKGTNSIIKCKVRNAEDMIGYAVGSPDIMVEVDIKFKILKCCEDGDRGIFYTRRVKDGQVNGSIDSFPCIHIPNNTNEREVVLTKIRNLMLKGKKHTARVLFHQWVYDCDGLEIKCTDFVVCNSRVV